MNDGHCVTTGRFSDIVPSFSSGIESPHCLSRGFIDGEVRGKLPGHELQPISIGWILDRPDYEQFFMALESGPHNQIPNSIRGDFHTFTAPNDPIFYLHHRYLLVSIYSTVVATNRFKIVN